MKAVKIFIYLQCCFFPAISQTLSPESAIEIALKNNLELIISKNNMEIANISYSKGNAGMLPNLQLLGGGNFSQNDTKQNLLNGTVVDRSGANSNAINASINMNWTLFDGMKMFISYKRLNAEKEWSENQLKQDMENIISQVLIQYFSLVKVKQLIASYKFSIELYNSRKEIAEAKWKNGILSKMVYLQSQVDLNEQEANLLNLKSEEQTLKTNLNQLLSREAENQFDVIDSIPIKYFPQLEELKSNYKKNNARLKSQQINIEIAKMKLKEIQSQYFPQIILNSGYNFNRVENQAGFILLNSNLGLNAGITASWNLFNGGNTKRLIQSGKIQNSNAELMFNALQIGVESELFKNYIKYKNFEEIMKLEESNLIIAKENAENAIETFRLGAVTALEVKEAQKSYQDAIQRTINIRLELKKTEIELMRLNGVLIK